MVGDSKYDAIGSEQADIDFIAVTYGFGFKTKDEVNHFPNVCVASSIDGLMDLFTY